MSKSSRDDVMSDLASKLFSAMLDDIVMDVALQSHQEVARNRAVCDICHTCCGLVHVSGPSAPSSQTMGASSRPPSPSSESKSINGNLKAGTSTPTNSINKNDGNVYFECLHCNRQIASNRYAPHLSTCMGIGARKGRNVTSKSKLSSEAGRSTSPYFGSDNGYVSDDNKMSKLKGKSKAKRADDAEFNLNRKRPASPAASPSKKSKKPMSGLPIGRTKTEPDLLGMSEGSQPTASQQSKISSKLRETSIVSHSSSVFDSSGSSSSSSAMSAGSPSLSAGAIAKKSRKNVAKPVSPPRVPPPTVRIPEPDYLIDVEGDETGSSTDTDSS